MGHGSSGSEGKLRMRAESQRLRLPPRSELGPSKLTGSCSHKAAHSRVRACSTHGSSGSEGNLLTSPKLSEARAQRMVRTGQVTWDTRPLRACPNSLPACSLHTALTQLSHLCLSARSLSQRLEARHCDRGSARPTAGHGGLLVTLLVTRGRLVVAILLSELRAAHGVARQRGDRDVGRGR